MVALGIVPAKTPATKDTLGKRPASSQNGTNEEAKRLAAAALSAVKDVASATTAAGSGKVEVCSDPLKQSIVYFLLFVHFLPFLKVIYYLKVYRISNVAKL